MVSYLILSSPWNAIQNNDSYEANQSDSAFRYDFSIISNHDFYQRSSF